ncbi:hypothetical protein HID58_056244, partial [Brassica napus]
TLSPPINRSVTLLAYQFFFETCHLHLSISPTISYGTVSPLKLSVSRMFLWAEFRDPRFYPSSCESLPSITTIGGLTEAARLSTSQVELKDGTTRAPIVRLLSRQRESRSLRNVGCHFQQIYEATNCSLYIGREKMAMYGSVVTPVWCNGDGHGNQSDESPDMDVIGISDNFFSDINKPAAVNCIEGHGSSLGRFKSHTSNILLAKIQPKTWRALKLMEAINSNHRTFTISTITKDTIIENHGKEHSENILPSSEGDVGLTASSGPSVLGDKVDEECAAADPAEISDAQNNRKRCPYGIFESVQAQDQSEFISLACGLVPKETVYTEKSTNIIYESDANYIDSGLVGRINDANKTRLQQQYWTLRSFPEGERNCYNFNLTANRKYLIKASFNYGNYDDLNRLPRFDLHIGPNKWTSVSFPGGRYGSNREMI